MKTRNVETVTAEILKRGGVIKGDNGLIHCPDPDHTDKNPSFSVSLKPGPMLGFGKCWSCKFKANFETWTGYKVEKSDDEIVVVDKFPNTGYRLGEGEEITKDWRGISAELLRKFGAVKLGSLIRFKVTNSLGYFMYYVGVNNKRKWKEKGSESGSFIFGIEYAKEMDSVDGIVVVEGARDALMLIQHGIPACAILGSYITDEQRDLLINYKIKVFTAFDNNLAGDKATAQGITYGFEPIKYKGDDPASCTDILKYFGHLRVENTDFKYSLPAQSKAKFYWSDAAPGIGKTERFIKLVCNKLNDKFTYVAPTHALLKAVYERLVAAGIDGKDIGYINSEEDYNNEDEISEDEKVFMYHNKLHDSQKQMNAYIPKRIVLCTHSALLVCQTFVTENRILVIDESVAPLNIIKSHIKYDEYPKGSVAVASSVSNRGVSRIIDKTGSKVIVGEFPEIARYVYYSKATIWIASALKHSAVFQRLYSELRKMHIPVKHITINSGRKTGKITIQRMTDTNEMLSKSLLDRKIFRPKDIQYGKLLMERKIVEKDGLVMDLSINKTIQLVRYFRGMSNTLCFTRSPNSYITDSIYSRGSFISPNDVKFIHNYDSLADNKERDSSPAMGSVNRKDIVTFNHFSGFEKIMQVHYEKIYNRPQAKWDKASMDYDRFGIAKSSIAAGLNSMSMYEKIVFIAPMILNVRQRKMYSTLYPQYEPAMGILGSAMLQCLLRGCARKGKNMTVAVWSSREVKILKTILTENSINFIEQKDSLWPNWVVDQNESKKRVLDGLNKFNRQHAKKLFEDIVSGRKSLSKAIDRSNSKAVKNMVAWLNNNRDEVSKISKKDIKMLIDLGLGKHSGLE